MNENSFVINLNKPEGLSSNKALQRVKKKLDIKKIGHGGTLDPMARGVLLILCGSATKIFDYILTLNKQYIATMKLGTSTETLDREGSVIKEMPYNYIEEQDVEKCLENFKGELEQTPPMHSALRIKGQRLYKLARKGIAVERKARKINIYDIKLLEYKLPFIKIKVSCSKGTYIRSLANDIAEKLGTCGHLYELERTKIGHFHIENSIEENTICKDSKKGFYTIDQTILDLPNITLSKEEIIKMIKIGRIDASLNIDKKTAFKIKDIDGNLIGIGYAAEGQIRLSTLLINQYK
ncbi:tRNA pseudouridine synthase B [Candidatus Magnetoovum chiemensis]|nr:tRNA pseudouridine synthase B [Candidatus Magnetoovum chiemensis]